MNPTIVNADQEKASANNAVIRQDLAEQIAELLIDAESENKSKPKSQKRLQSALPGESQTYAASSHLLKGTQFISIFTFALHIFQMGDTYAMWGGGQWRFILITVALAVCCAYSFFLVTLEKGTPLEYMYRARFAFVAIYLLVLVTILIPTFAAAMAFAVSDQLAIYTVSESVLNFSVVILVPFTIMAAMTTCAYNLRYYEIFGDEAQFPLGPNTLFDWMSADKRVDVENVDQMTTRLLSSYLHDPAASARAPVPSLQKTRITVITL